MSSLQSLCNRYGISITCKSGAPVNETFCDSDGWTCTLRFDGRRMTVPFYMGRGHGGKEPSSADVLACLISDASSVENARDFADWCGDLGYDVDSRKAEATYKACQKSARKVRQLLGDAFDTLAGAEH